MAPLPPIDTTTKGKPVKPVVPAEPYRKWVKAGNAGFVPSDAQGGADGKGAGTALGKIQEFATPPHGGHPCNYAPAEIISVANKRLNPSQDESAGDASDIFGPGWGNITKYKKSQQIILKEQKILRFESFLGGVAQYLPSELAIPNIDTQVVDARDARWLQRGTWASNAHHRGNDLAGKLRGVVLGRLAELEKLLKTDEARANGVMRASLVAEYLVYLESLGQFASKGVDKCGDRILPNRKSAELHWFGPGKGKDGWYGGDKFSWTNIQRCGNQLLCYHCAGIIQARNRERLEKLFAWCKIHGYRFYFVTYTVQHGRNDKMVRLLPLMRDMLREVTQSESWRKHTSYTAAVTALEATWGEDTGPHPHFHGIYIDTSGKKDPYTPQEIAARQEYISRKWCNAAKKHGLVKDFEIKRYLDMRAHAVEVQAGTDENQVKYLSKVLPFEMASPDTKAAREDSRMHYLGPGGVNDLAMAGSRQHVLAWLDYKLAVKGVAAMYWTAGLKDMAGVDEQTDEKVVNGTSGDKALGWEYEQDYSGRRDKSLEMRAVKAGRDAVKAGARDFNAVNAAIAEATGQGLRGEGSKSIDGPAAMAGQDYDVMRLCAKVEDLQAARRIKAATDDDVATAKMERDNLLNEIAEATEQARLAAEIAEGMAVEQAEWDKIKDDCPPADDGDDDGDDEAPPGDGGA